MLKTEVVDEPLKKALQPFAASIKAAFVYGSVAKGHDTAQSDIDLVVIGHDLDYSALYTAAQTAEAALRRKVNPMFLAPKDWQRKAGQKGSFVQKVSTQPKIFILGSEAALRS